MSIPLCLQWSRDSFGLDEMCRTAEQLLSAKESLDLGKKIGRWSLFSTLTKTNSFFLCSFVVLPGVSLVSCYKF